MNKPDIALLPNGLMDLLPPQAEQEAMAVHTLMESFKSFGYGRVKPPLVEFEESLLAPGPGQSLALQTFRLMDPVSQRMMGVRADTTAQISRIASSRLAEDRRPLRLAYASDVLRVNGSQLRPERQFCQVGCELIGDEDLKADAEIALIALNGLSKIGVQDITIDLTVPSLIENLFDAHDVSDAQKTELKEALARRDFDAIDPLQSELHQTLTKLLGCVGVADDVLPQLLEIVLPGTAAQNVIEIKTVYDELKSALHVYNLNTINLTIDAVEHKGFEYHKGVSFTLFARDVRGELGSGGRYSTSDETATGFTLYMDTILRALPEGKTDKIQSGKDWAEIKSIQDQNKIAKREG